MEASTKRIKIFQTASGKQPFLKWLLSLKDERGVAAVKARLARIRLGNLGLTRSLGGGLHEIKINHGPGYRVYFGQDGIHLVILLCGGDKGDQDEEIKKAKEYWACYKRSKKNADD